MSGFDYNNQIVLGNAFQQPVLEILNGEKYQLLRIAHGEMKFSLFPNSVPTLTRSFTPITTTCPKK